MYYELFNPDGAQITTHRPIKSKKDVISAYQVWAIRYEAQGFFEDKRGRHISIEELPQNCYTIGYKTKDLPTGTIRISELIK